MKVSKPGDPDPDLPSVDDPILDDYWVDLFMAALRRGQANPTKADVIAVLRHARQLLVNQAQLDLIERGEMALEVDAQGKIVLSLTKGKLT